MSSWEKIKEQRRKDAKALRRYLRGRPPQITKGVAVFENGDRYQILHSGWRRLGREITEVNNQ